MDRPKQIQEGYSAKEYGMTIDENPYDRARQPDQYKSWRTGWKQANFENKNHDF